MVSETKCALLVFYELVLPNKNYPSMLAFYPLFYSYMRNLPLLLIEGKKAQVARERARGSNDMSKEHRQKDGYKGGLKSM